MATTQLWNINGQQYNREQLAELRKQGFDPLKDKVEMKKVTSAKGEKQEEVEPSVWTGGELETDQQEYERLKQEKAWVNPEKKARYNELKEKFAK